MIERWPLVTPQQLSIFVETILQLSKKEKLLLRFLSGNADANFDLDDLIAILVRLGFEERKTGGSHRIFSVEGVEGIINLQKTKDGKAKSYQVKQTREFLINNRLIGSDE